MKEIKLPGKCPWCGSAEFTEAMARYVSPLNDKLHGSVMYHTICLECGTVLRSYIKDVKPFLRKK